MYTIELRGVEYDAVIDVNGGYEPDTNAHEIEWHFEGMTPVEHDALGLTDEEEQSIYEQLAEALSEGDHG